MSAPLRSVARAVHSGHADPLMQAALTRQLFRESGPFAARWNAGGQVQIYVRYDRFSVAPDIAALRKLGATKIRTAKLLGAVQAWVPADKLATVAALPWVQRLTLPQYALASPAGATPRAASAPPNVDQFFGAAAFRSATGDTGQGITVGVISSGAAGINESHANGDLPAGVWVDPNLPGDATPGAGGEGTAMLELVHTLAPGAALAFCGPNTTAEYLNCLSDLQTHGAQVIVDDLTFPVTAYFTNDSDVLAVQQWQAQHPAVRLVTAAGNFGTSFWSGAYLPMPINPTVINGVTYSEAANFGSSAAPNQYMNITVAPGTLSYVLQWDDPWVLTSQVTSATPGDPNDYDVFLYDANGKVIACNQGVTGDQDGCNQSGAAASATPGPQPIMVNQWVNTSAIANASVKLAIYYRAGTPGTALKLFVASPDSCSVQITPVNPAGSIVGHAQLPYPAEITIGAIYAPYALNTPPKYALEPYSSQGPVNLPLLPAGGQTIAKPDFVGVDGVSVSGAGGFPPAGCGAPAPNPPVFYGTSAAAPGVAALIALLESAGYSSDQVYGVLQSNTIRLATNGGAIPNGLFGYGLPNINAVKALNVALGLVLNAGNTSVMSGRPFTLNVTVQNKSIGTAATNVVLTVSLPPGVVFQSTNASAYCEPNSQVVTCTWPNLGMGQSQQVGITATASAPGSYTENVNVSAPQPGASAINQSASATYTVNDAQPIAANGSVNTDTNTAVNGVLSVTGSGPLTFAIVTQPKNGLASLTNVNTGAFAYMPNTGFSGSDSFTFTASNSGGTSNTGSETITVKAVPSPPPPPPKPSKSGGGGGGLGLLGLAFLLAGVAARKRSAVHV